ncbi:MAG: LysR family transcriptional regulator [Marinosulfonomonas sp.]|nr:MAG: LysR family transcriptional regulator [Marinosulfonomonas sp.]
MATENWDEFRTALEVARIGTVSGAADVLGVHHATVIRHVDALEDRLGVKLFQRHARGYKPTEAGEDLLQVASVTEEQLGQLVGRIKGRSSAVTGELILTTLSGFSGILTPVLARFQAQNPEVKIKYLTAARLFRLEYGEAHIAIRAGPKPQEPDNVVQHLATISPRLCVAQSYVERYGVPKNPGEFLAHRFVGAGSDSGRAPHEVWSREHIPQENIVFRATERLAQEAAVRQGAGIGFVTNMVSDAQLDLQVVMDRCEAWNSDLWLVTHIDLHRTAKVQAVLKALKDEARLWQNI